MTRPIPGFETRYWAHSSGKIISLPYRNRYSLIIMKESKTGRYPVVSIKGRTRLVHRLIAQAFIPNPDNKPCVNHKNGIKNNNRPENLEWCTVQENTRHSYDNGFQVAKKGSASPVSKLTDEQVFSIKEDTRPYCEIAKNYNISNTVIWGIKNGRSWKHVLNENAYTPISKRPVLTENQAKDVKYSTEPAHIIAVKHNIDVSSVYRIKNGRRWKHI